MYVFLYVIGRYIVAVAVEAVSISADEWLSAVGVDGFGPILTSVVDVHYNMILWNTYVQVIMQ